MSKEIYHQTPENNKKMLSKTEYQELRNKVKIIMAGAAFLAIILTGIGGIGLNAKKSVNYAKNKLDHLANPPTTFIDSEGFSIPTGGNVVTSAEITIDRMAEENGIDNKKIPFDQIVYESQEALHKNGGSTDPGDKYVATITQYENEKYSVSVEPNTPVEQK